MTEPVQSCSAGSWDALAKWLDGQILEASAWQRVSFEARKDLQGERWHARQCALYEVKMKLESSSAVEQDAVNVRGAGSIPASPATTFSVAQPARKYDMRALAKFLYEHCALDPDKAGDVAATLLEEYTIWPDDFAAQPPAAPVEKWPGERGTVANQAPNVDPDLFAHSPCSADSCDETAPGQSLLECRDFIAALVGGAPFDARACEHARELIQNADTALATFDQPQTLPESHLRALNEFVTLSEEDYCSDDTEEGDWAEPDDEPVAAGQDHVSCVTFGSVRRAREAIDALLALSRPERS